MRSLPLVLVIFWFYFLVPYVLQWMTGASGPVPVGAFTSALDHLHALRGRLLLRDHARGHPVDPARAAAAAQAIGTELLAVHALRHPAAGLPQHAAGDSDADDHALPGYVAGLRRLADRTSWARPRRSPSAMGVSWRCISSQPSSTSSSALLRLDGSSGAFSAGRHHPLKALPCPLPPRRRPRPMIEIDNICKWYGTSTS